MKQNKFLLLIVPLICYGCSDFEENEAIFILKQSDISCDFNGNHLLVDTVFGFKDDIKKKIVLQLFFIEENKGSTDKQRADVASKKMYQFYQMYKTDTGYYHKIKVRDFYSTKQHEYNGSYSKKVKTESLGNLVLNIPRDWKSDFEPQLIPKGQRMSDKLEEAIIGMYGRGMTTSDISEQVKEAYGVDVNEGTISNVTTKVIELVKEWQNRPLEPVYFTVWMDGIVLKVKQGGKYINKCIYLVIGLKKDGLKEVLGMWLAETESASFWMSVLTDLKARGVEDILIACTDNLKGFTDAIKGVFPQTVTQLCIVHQIRNSCKYVVWKDRKPFCADLKDVYTAPNKAAAEQALTGFAAKWEAKYKHAIYRGKQIGKT